jgi:transposase
LDSKKKAIVPTERDRASVIAARAAFVEKLRLVPLHQLVFLDETGSHVAMTRSHGRGPAGARVMGRVPRNRGVVTTVLGAIARRGLTALMTVHGGTSKEVFMTFVREHLVPTLRRGDVVVMDNLGAHHAHGIRAAIEAAGASVVYMPPYSPDLNPIELCWSKLKQLLRSLGARSVKDLWETVQFVGDFITRRDAVGWFRHCGYRNRQPS